MADTAAKNDTNTEPKTSSANKSDTAGADTVSGYSPFVPSTTDEVRIASSQPPNLGPDGDVVAMVSRDVNGHPRQSENFTVLIPEGVSDAQRDAHWNRAGEAQGAKHLSGGGQEAVPVYRSWDALTPQERAKRDETETRELARHNFRDRA